MTEGSRPIRHPYRRTPPKVSEEPAKPAETVASTASSASENKAEPPTLMDQLPGLLDSASEQLPGVARIAAQATMRSAVWTAGASGRSSRLLMRALTDPHASSELFEEIARDVAEAARAVSDVAREVGNGTPLSQALLDGGSALSQTLAARSAAEQVEQSVEPSPEDLRVRGAALLERSRDVRNEEKVHPAFGRILDDLAPDEARILLLLLRGGPQPTVDVRTGGPVGMVSSQLIASGLNMIGPRAGTRYVERVPAYLNNLFRLGLIWLSRESLDDPIGYQVVEAQPDVLEAMHSVRFTKVVRRSIHLTPFGEDFVRACLADETTAAADLPAHAVPPEEHEPGQDAP
ncbi:Abi-alpha family protein [Nocardioides speluncae]|uniref:Abi-alpha family protein n=1 Tax=Nocardioides speluncae TaxID=2670337 RepID=UPI00198196E6|nr:Abi-alpha family protein [Nocardioides speluncae]